MIVVSIVVAFVVGVGVGAVGGLNKDKVMGIFASIVAKIKSMFSKTPAVVAAPTSLPVAVPSDPAPTPTVGASGFSPQQPPQ